MTLVEIMVAMVILGFGLLGVAAMQVRAVTESSGGLNQSTASTIARNRVEELMRIGWSDASLNSTGGNWNAGTMVPDPLAQTAQQYQRSERITWDAATPTVKSIEVQVSWSDQKRQNRSFVLASARLKESNE